MTVTIQRGYPARRRATLYAWLIGRCSIASITRITTNAAATQTAGVNARRSADSSNGGSRPGTSATSAFVTETAG
jgi:hypothetical protein